MSGSIAALRRKRCRFFLFSCCYIVHADTTRGRLTHKLTVE